MISLLRPGHSGAGNRRGPQRALRQARLRYQPTPLFAPYAGIEYRRAFGDTTRFRRAEGENRDSLNLLARVRFFF